VLGIFGGVCSLINAYDDSAGRATRLAIFGTYVVALLLVYFVQSIVTSFSSNLLIAGIYEPAPQWFWLIISHWTEGVVAATVVLLVLRRVIQRRAVRHLRVSHRLNGVIGSHRIADAAAQLSVIYVLIVGVLYGLIIARINYADLDRCTAVLLTRIIQLTSLIVTTLALIAQVLALPTKDAPRAAEGSANSSPLTGAAPQTTVGGLS
jgi:hypothetical protein